MKCLGPKCERRPEGCFVGEWYGVGVQREKLFQTPPEYGDLVKVGSLGKWKGDIVGYMSEERVGDHD